MSLCVIDVIVVPGLFSVSYRTANIHTIPQNLVTHHHVTLETQGMNSKVKLGQ